MKREIGAALLLLALIAASVWNIHRADSLTGEIKEHLKNGETVPGAKLVENESLQIK